MKELSIEEKAKRYDEAIKRARIWREKSGMPNDRKGVLDDIFPELKESEDEKIRKWIKKELESKYVVDNIVNDVMADKAFGWLEKQGEDDKKGYSVWVGGFEINDYNLSKEEAEKLAEEYKKDGYDDVIVEKQGEQKPANKVEPKFKVGDWVVDNCGYTWKIEEILNQFYLLEDIEVGESRPTIEWVNKTFHLWTIEDAKDGDVLCDYCEEYDNPLIFILKKFERVDFGLVKPSDYSSYCFLTAGDMQRLKKGTYHHIHNIKPATKEQRDLLFQKMKEAGYEWNVEKKELKKIVVPTWSEDDEKGLGDALWCCKQAASIAKDENDMGNAWYAENWLKNLKERYTWKPSKKQLDGIECAIKTLRHQLNVGDKRLDSLYEDLKKLREK